MVPYRIRKKQRFKKLSSIIAIMVFSTMLLFNPIISKAEDPGDKYVPGAASIGGITPDLYPGNDSNSDNPLLKGYYSVKCDLDVMETDGAFEISQDDHTVPEEFKTDINQNLTLTFHGEEKAYVKWELKPASKLQVALVVVKGGNAYNVFNYNYKSKPFNTDDDLHSPKNIKNDKYPAISHVTVYLKIKSVEPTPKGNIKITKQWLDSKGNTVEHSKYEGNLFNLTMDGNIVATGDPIDNVLEFKDLPFGTYELTEQVIDGFKSEFTVNEQLVSGKIIIQVKDEKLIPINVKNIKNEDPVDIPKGSIEITKQWLDSKGNAVAHGDYTGNLFTLTKDGIAVASENTVEGVWEFKDLPFGTYELTEQTIEGFTPENLRLTNN